MTSMTPAARYHWIGLTGPVIKTIPERSVAAALAALPKSASSFELLDLPVLDTPVDPELFTIDPIPQNVSVRHWVSGEVFTVDQLRDRAEQEGDPEAYDVLIGNITDWSTGQPLAILCDNGHWQHFNETDVLAEDVLADESVQLASWLRLADERAARNAPDNRVSYEGR